MHRSKPASAELIRLMTFSGLHAPSNRPIACADGTPALPCKQIAYN